MSFKINSKNKSFIDIYNIILKLSHTYLIPMKKCSAFWIHVSFHGSRHLVTTKASEVELQNACCCEALHMFNRLWTNVTVDDLTSKCYAEWIARHLKIETNYVLNLMWGIHVENNWKSVKVKIKCHMLSNTLQLANLCIYINYLNIFIR